jgi:hypothetical protein
VSTSTPQTAATAHLIRNVCALVVQAAHSRRQRALVLSLQHDVHHAHLGRRNGRQGCPERVMRDNWQGHRARCRARARRRAGKRPRDAVQLADIVGLGNCHLRSTPPSCSFRPATRAARTGDVPQCGPWRQEQYAAAPGWCLCIHQKTARLRGPGSRRCSCLQAAAAQRWPGPTPVERWRQLPAGRQQDGISLGSNNHVDTEFDATPTHRTAAGGARRTEEDRLELAAPVERENACAAGTG